MNIVAMNILVQSFGYCKLSFSLNKYLAVKDCAFSLLYLLMFVSLVPRAVPGTVQVLNEYSLSE